MKRNPPQGPDPAGIASRCIDAVQRAQEERIRTYVFTAYLFEKDAQRAKELERWL